MKPEYYLKNPVREYRVWHGPKETLHKHGRRKLKIVEALTGEQARQQVIAEYPEHVVGPPILCGK